MAGPGRGRGAPEAADAPPPRTFRSPGLPVSIAKRAVGAWGQVVDLAGETSLFFLKKKFLIIQFSTMIPRRYPRKFKVSLKH